MIINPRERYFYNKGREEGREEGRKKGLEIAKMEVAKEMLNYGYPMDEITEVTGISKSKLQEDFN